MEILIYSSVGCTYCDKIKELMKRADKQYTEVIWQKLSGDEQEDLQMKYKIHGFPFVLIDGEPVGGLVETAKLFLEKGLVSSRKK